MKVGVADVARFTDGEVYVQINENVRGEEVVIIQPTCPPVIENLMELLVMLDAFKRASARRVTAVVPYYGYGRQDRKAQSRVPISAKLVADLLSAAGTDRVLTMDLHSAQIQGFFDKPVDHLFAAPVIIDYISKLKLPRLTVVSPDAGGVERARAYAATGVDAIFITGLKTLQEFEAIRAAVALPIIVGTTPTIKREDLASRGVRLLLQGHQPVAGAVKALRAPSVSIEVPDSAVPPSARCCSAVARRAVSAVSTSALIRVPNRGPSRGTRRVVPLAVHSMAVSTPCALRTGRKDTARSTETSRPSFAGVHSSSGNPFTSVNSPP